MGTSLLLQALAELALLSICVEYLFYKLLAQEIYFGSLANRAEGP
jgi:hypothetical protein